MVAPAVWFWGRVRVCIANFRIASVRVDGGLLDSATLPMPLKYATPFQQKRNSRALEYLMKESQIQEIAAIDAANRRSLNRPVLVISLRSSTLWFKLS
jgi:hypothetical protein